MSAFGSLSPCPCGSGNSFSACCGRYIGGVPAPDAVSLMRSRYTAYVLGENEYLLRTWHPRTRPPRLAANEGPRWLSLAIRGHGGNEQEAWVEFIARHANGQLHEISRFVATDGEWLYLGGKIQRHPPAVSRNGPCPCGSGRKYKRCCA